jgi:DNA-binding CsgD family transcriptional regulator
MTEKIKKPTLLDDLALVWPGIRYLGFGVWLSWTYLSYGSAIWLSGIESDGSNLTIIFLLSTGTAALVLLLSALFHKRVDLMLDSSLRVFAMGALVMVGALLIILAGPYYLATKGLSFLGAFLTGVGSALLFLKCGKLYGSLKPRTALVYAALSLLVITIIYFFVSSNSLFEPVKDGPSLTGMLAFVLLPLFAAALMGIPLPIRQAAPRSLQDINDHKMPLQDFRLLPLSFWKFMLAIFSFTLATSIIRGFNVGTGTASELLASSAPDMLLRLIFSLIAICYAVHFLKNGNLGKLYVFVMVFITMVMSVSPLLEIADSPFALLVNFAFSIFDFFIWCLLAFLAFEKQVSPVIVFGFGRGVFMAAMTIGWLIGVRFMSALEGTFLGSAIYVGLAVIILIVVSLIFSEREIDKMLTPRSLDPGDELTEQLHPTLQAGRQGSDESRDPARPFINACRVVGKSARLSAREQDVFEQLALGRGSENIAKRLTISLNTVRAHTHNVYAKLDVHSRQELIELVEAQRKQLEPH